MTSGPLFLSETESDSEDDTEPPPIQRKSLPTGVSFPNIAPPPYTRSPLKYGNQPADSSRMKRSMQNL